MNLLIELCEGFALLFGVWCAVAGVMSLFDRPRPEPKPAPRTPEQDDRATLIIGAVFVLVCLGFSLVRG